MKKDIKKELWKAMTTLQATIDSRKGEESINNALKKLEEVRKKIEEEETGDVIDIPLSISLGAYCGTCNGLIGLFVGTLVGFVIDNIVVRTESGRKIIEGITTLIYEVNKDSKNCK